METIQNQNQINQNDDFISMKELASLYLSHWYWFAISLFVCLAIAAYYLITTPPVYTRYASVLVKQDSKGRTVNADVTSSISDLGMFRSRSNINNEIINFQSPNLMFEVVKRLHLNIDYKTDGAFYKRTLYGDQLPVVVTFDGLKNNESATLTLKMKNKGQVELSDFTRRGENVGDKPVVATIGREDHSERIALQEQRTIQRQSLHHPQQPLRLHQCLPQSPRGAAIRQRGNSHRSYLPRREHTACTGSAQHGDKCLQRDMD